MDTVRQAEEALDICKWLGNTVEQAYRLHDLAYLPLGDKQLGAAEDAVPYAQSIYYPPEQGRNFLLCQSHQVLGRIDRCKGDR